MNNKQLAKEIKSVTRQGDHETQLEAIENLLNKHRPEQLHKPDVLGSCFCGKPAVIHAFDTNFCQQHNEELAKSFEARMKEKPDESG